MKVGLRGGGVGEKRLGNENVLSSPHLAFLLLAPLSMLRNDDDEEEAARERRRRARQERLRSRESEEPSSQPDGAVMTNSHR